jgi:hypothetical protein
MNSHRLCVNVVNESLDVPPVGAAISETSIIARGSSAVDVDNNFSFVQMDPKWDE